MCKKTTTQTSWRYGGHFGRRQATITPTCPISDATTAIHDACNKWNLDVAEEKSKRYCREIRFTWNPTRTLWSLRITRYILDTNRWRKVFWFDFYIMDKVHQTPMYILSSYVISGRRYVIMNTRNWVFIIKPAAILDRFVEHVAVTHNAVNTGFTEAQHQLCKFCFLFMFYVFTSFMSYLNTCF